MSGSLKIVLSVNSIKNEICKYDGKYLMNYFLLLSNCLKMRLDPSIKKGILNLKWMLFFKDLQQ